MVFKNKFIAISLFSHCDSPSGIRLDEETKGECDNEKRADDEEMFFHLQMLHFHAKLAI